MEPKMLKDAFSFMFPPMIPTSIINHIIKTNMYKWTTMELRDTPPWKCMTRVLRSMGTSLSFSFLCLGTESPMLTRIPCREPTLAGSFDCPQNEIGWRVGTIEVFSSTPVPIHITPPFCGWMKRMNAPPPPKFSHGERSRSQSPAHHGSGVDQEDVLDGMGWYADGSGMWERVAIWIIKIHSHNYQK